MPYKFNGKELDEETGLYYYGARYMQPMASIWYGVDPLTEKYPNVSGYVCCVGNPVKLVDPDGENPVYNLGGDYLGDSSEGFTGQIYVYTGMEKLDFSSHDISYWTNKEGDYGMQMMTYDEVERSYTGKAKANFESKILNHVASKSNGKKIYEKVFNMSTLKGGKIEYSEKEGSNFSTWRKHQGVKVKMEVHADVTTDYEGTVENLLCTILVHEWYTHGYYKVGDAYNNHNLAYKNILNDKEFYPKTTNKYKEFIKGQYQYYKQKEQKNK